MFLKEYTHQRAKALEHFHSSDMTQIPDILWFELLDGENIREKTYPNTHSHTFFEIHLVYSGEVCYQCGNKKIPLGKNQAIFIPPKLPHRFVNSSENVCKASMAFSVSDCTMLQKELQICDFPKEIYEITDFILTVSMQKTQLHSLIILGRVYEILQIIFRCLNIFLPEIETSENDARIAVAKSFIQKNIHKRICSGDVAKECCLSSKQLGRIFRQQTGHSVYSYISEAKLEYSKKLLLQNQKSIKEISLLTGFENESGFVSFFKRHCGMPPGMFRELRCQKSRENEIKCP